MKPQYNIFRPLNKNEKCLQASEWKQLTFSFSCFAHTAKHIVFTLFLKMLLVFTLMHRNKVIIQNIKTIYSLLSLHLKLFYKHTFSIFFSLNRISTRSFMVNQLISFCYVFINYSLYREKTYKGQKKKKLLKTFGSIANYRFLWKLGYSHFWQVVVLW